ncbi:MAG TPA: proton-conducting transporter membrane subunit [Rubrivivax sp.]|nr:proton-conducting transporter membrane subunit [Rubrivivax sp.]
MDRSALLLAVIALPLALLAACLWPAARRAMPWLLPVAPLPGIAAALLGVGAAPLRLGAGHWAPVLMLDLGGALLLGTAALLWALAALYARRYMAGNADLGRFCVCWLMTLTGCLGAFVAADMVSLYLLLGLLSVGACGLVIHDQTPRAWRGGGMYLALALFGESCALMGFVLLAAAAPDGSLLIRDAVAALPGSPARDLTLACLIVGLGLKAGLVPLHMWMPLAHAAAPVPASAVLSGAVVKVGIIGLMRFLPLDAAMPDWGEALAAVGLFTALYGVAVGITQQHPKAVLAYSSVSQMGVIVAVLGMGWAAGDAGAALSAAFYASHHVLVKGTLFLAVGLVAATASPRRLWPLLALTAVLGLGLGGLPLTGGALAKYAVKGPLGDGLAGTLGKVSAAGTTLLVLHFMHRLRDFASKERPQAGLAGRPPGGYERSGGATFAHDPGETAPAGLWWPWLALAAASLVVPWALYLSVPGGTVGDLLAPKALWAALLPMLAGAAAALLLWRFGAGLPRIPEGDLVRLIDVAVARCKSAGPALVHANGLLLQWPVAGVLLLAAVLAFGLSLFGWPR